MMSNILQAVNVRHDDALLTMETFFIVAAAVGDFRWKKFAFAHTSFLSFDGSPITALTCIWKKL